MSVLSKTFLRLALSGVFFLPAISTFADDVQQKFLPEGVTKKVGGYRPMRAG
jgi:hypothetical protein